MDQYPTQERANASSISGNPMLCEKADGWFYQDGQCCAWNSGDVDVYGMTIYAPPP